MDFAAPLDLARTIVLIGLATLAAAHDVRFQRIPNRLTTAGLVVGLLLAAGSGWGVAFQHLLAAAVTLAVGIPLFSVRVLGGGDIKLMTAIAAILGPATLPDALLLAVALGGVLALADCLRRGIILPVLLSCRDLLAFWVTLGRRGRPLSATAGPVTTIPYGVAIGLGSVLAWLS